MQVNISRSIELRCGLVDNLVNREILESRREATNLAPLYLRIFTLVYVSKREPRALRLNTQRKRERSGKETKREIVRGVSTGVGCATLAS